MAIPPFPTGRSPLPTAVRGFALYTALIFLLVLTLLGVAMYSSMGLQQRMAGDMQQKLRALTAADNATGVAEAYVQQNALPVLSVCSGQTTAPRICPFGSLLNPVANATWSAGGVGVQLTGTDFPAGFVVPSGGVEGAYAAFPQYYIEQLPPLAGYTLGTGQQYGGGSPVVNFYRITGWGVGGNTNAVAIVQTIYRP